MSGLKRKSKPKWEQELGDVDLHYSLPSTFSQVASAAGMESSSGPSSSSSSSHTKEDSKWYTVTVTPGPSDDKVEVTLTGTKMIGNGSFGMVYQAQLMETGETVAIKKVFQDKRFKNRELQIMRKLNHCNIVKLLYFYYSSSMKKDGMYLHLVLEFMPENLYCLARHYNKRRNVIPIFLTKLYAYQLFRSMNYIHSLGICHRDIKPQNLLIDSEKGILKLCDFGSAKRLVEGEPNVAYICSRYYRAPELIFGAVDYTTRIDVWSGGCVLAEMLLGKPIFPGDSGVDQLVEIIKVLGTPTREQIHHMNPDYTEFKFPRIKAHPWNSQVFPSRTPAEALSLVASLLEYSPQCRLSPLQAMAHPFFSALRQAGACLPGSGQPLPLLFDFSPQELEGDGACPSLLDQLLPE